jgi:protein-ribulosamine 3-kinase
MIEAAVSKAVTTAVSNREARACEIVSARAAGGGCINSACHLELTGSLQLFLKYNPNAPADMFAKEAAGLELPRSAQSIRIPKVYYVTPPEDGAQFLLLEDVLVLSTNPTTLCDTLGQGLAGIHRVSSEYYGLGSHNYLGPTFQRNDVSPSWADFFVTHRLAYMLELMERRNFANDNLRHFHDFLPRAHAVLSSKAAEPPSLVHGDLWGGNVLDTSAGEHVLIDPAVYFGDREVDLAMTRLFGGFNSRFYEEYEEAFPLQDGWRERQDIYNLYHILHHALLFGGGYFQQAKTILKHYF